MSAVGSALRRAAAVSGAVVACAAVVAGAGAATAAAAQPTQFVAKLYTEALGRVPDQAGWADAMSFFDRNGCSQATLKTKGEQIFGSPEYAGLGYANASKALTAYRAVLSSEPDQAGYDNAVRALNGGYPFAQFVTDLFDSAAFRAMAATICSADQGYGWGANDAPTAPLGGAGFSGTQAALQAAIDATPAGGTLALAPRAVVRLTGTLFVKAGVTVTTTGAPGLSRYADMGRLVRQPGWRGVSVVLNPGARLERVWVSGARARESAYDRERYSVQVHGGVRAGVIGSRVDNPSGASSIRALGTADGFPCTDMEVTGNLVESYTADYFSVRQTDGISVGCEDTTITGNSVIDATDVALIVFAVSPTVAQASQVSGNTIVAAGHNANAALGADPWICTAGPDGPGVASRSLAGMNMTGNTFWTGSRTYFQIGISVGTREWFPTNGCNATGGSFTANGTGSGSARVGTGIAVSGVLRTTVTGNSPTIALVPGVNTCPSHAVGASVRDGYASGTIQTYTDALYFGCIYWPT
jgi:hypothetical protein